MGQSLLLSNFLIYLHLHYAKAIRQNNQSAVVDCQNVDHIQSYQSDTYSQHGLYAPQFIDPKWVIQGVLQVGPTQLAKLSVFTYIFPLPSPHCKRLQMTPHPPCPTCTDKRQQALKFTQQKDGRMPFLHSNWRSHNRHKRPRAQEPQGHKRGARKGQAPTP